MKKAVEQRVNIITTLHMTDLFLLSTDLLHLDCITGIKNPSHKDETWRKFQDEKSAVYQVKYR